jgi:hypothetical protein
MREVSAMARDRAKTTVLIWHTRGGYPAGPKTVSELDPPPKRPGVGAKPAQTSKK